jgi:hypothetical protein
MFIALLTRYIFFTTPYFYAIINVKHDLLSLLEHLSLLSKFRGVRVVVTSKIRLFADDSLLYLVCPKTWCSCVQLLGMDLMLLFLRFVHWCYSRSLTLSMPAALGTLISKNIFYRLRWSNAEQHVSSKATTQETLVQWQHYSWWYVGRNCICKHLFSV